jgi:hypothetical protein
VLAARGIKQANSVDRDALRQGIDGKRGSLHFFEWSFLYEVVNPETGEAESVCKSVCKRRKT